MALGEDPGQEGLLDEPVGHVVHALPPLVLDHLALGVELRLIERRGQERQPLGLEVEGPLQVLAGDRLEVDRHVLRRERVGLGPRLLERDVVVGHVLRAPEHHVLEEVGEPGPPRPLVLGADVVGHADHRPAARSDRGAAPPSGRWAGGRPRSPASGPVSSASPAEESVGRRSARQENIIGMCRSIGSEIRSSSGS